MLKRPVLGVMMQWLSISTSTSGRPCTSPRCTAKAGDTCKAVTTRTLLDADEYMATKMAKTGTTMCKVELAVLNHMLLRHRKGRHTSGLVSLGEDLIAWVNSRTTASTFCNGLSVPLPGRSVYCWSCRHIARAMRSKRSLANRSSTTGRSVSGLQLEQSPVSPPLGRWTTTP